MSDHDAHVRQVQRLTNQIRNSPDPEVRERASEQLAEKWETYNNGR
jgi:oligoendopeptidase F